MRDIGEGTIRRIDWQELTPVVRLLRIFNVATSFRVMIIAFLGVVLTSYITSLTIVSLPDESCSQIPSLQQSHMLLPSRSMEQSNWERGIDVSRSINTTVSEPLGLFFGHTNLLLFRPDSEKVILPNRGTYLDWKWPNEYQTHAVWFAAVSVIWICCGGLICRVAALRLTIDES
ncbi:MAG: hypothetical protein ACRCUY_01685, partial [Thermoguttaceae bacterium]